MWLYGRLREAQGCVADPNRVRGWSPRYSTWPKACGPEPNPRYEGGRSPLRLQAASCTSTPSDQCDQVTKYTGRERNEGGRSPRTRLVRSTRQDRATPTKIDPTSFEASFPTQRVLRRRPPCPTSVLAHPSSHCWSASRSAFGFRCSHP